MKKTEEQSAKEPAPETFSTTAGLWYHGTLEPEKGLQNFLVLIIQRRKSSVYIGMDEENIFTQRVNARNQSEALGKAMLALPDYNNQHKLIGYHICSYKVEWIRTVDVTIKEL